MTHPNVLVDDARIAELLRATRRVAVLGIKTEKQADQAAHYVPSFLAERGLDVVPVPVYYPEVTTILGKQVFRDLAAVPRPVDLLDVFRKASDIPAHLADIRKLRPRLVWFQLGIRNDAAADELARDGLLVVQDRCLMVEWRRLVG
jgi:uncharacterized protein